MLACLLLLAAKARANSCYSQEIMDLAKSQLYVREKTNNNDAPEIDGYLKYLGLPKGLSYCITFDIWAIGKTYEAHGLKCPVPKIGKVSTLLKTVKKDKYKFTVHSARDVEYGIVKLKPAMIATWSHSKRLDRAGKDAYDWSGHAELVDCPTTYVKFDSVGANTTGTDDPRLQREQSGGTYKLGGPQGGVWKKHRSVSKQSSFYCEAFIELNN
jgi:hypothetical protein